MGCGRRPHLLKICVESDPSIQKNADFDRFRLTVPQSWQLAKSSLISNRKSTMRFQSSGNRRHFKFGMQSDHIKSQHADHKPFPKRGKVTSRHFKFQGPRYSLAYLCKKFDDSSFSYSWGICLGQGQSHVTRFLKWFSGVPLESMKLRTLNFLCLCSLRSTDTCVVDYPRKGWHCVRGHATSLNSGEYVIISQKRCGIETYVQWKTNGLWNGQHYEWPWISLKVTFLSKVFVNSNTSGIVIGITYNILHINRKAHQTCNLKCLFENKGLLLSELYTVNAVVSRKRRQVESFLPLDVIIARVLVVVVCLCVGLSVTLRCCIKTAKRRITQTTPRAMRL